MCVSRFIHCQFFFKRKTAYDMSMSDGRSDVCSSDLARQRERAEPAFAAMVDAIACSVVAARGVNDDPVGENRRDLFGFDGGRGKDAHARRMALRIGDGERSEEHTSELQSLMRISYAVFCLKKKTPT